MVPYNKDLILKFQAYINVKIHNHYRFVKYLFKYMNKELDQATVVIKKTISSELDKTITYVDVFNKIKIYFDCRHACSYFF